MSYVNQINRTFSTKQTHQPTAPAMDPAPRPMVEKGNSAIRAGSQASIPAPASSDSNAADSFSLPVTPSSGQGSGSPEASVNLFAENDSAYTMDRGAFEFRVATGEVSFLPPLTMTVITQRPEVHFEYTGGYHYVPASSFEEGILNLSI